MSGKMVAVIGACWDGRSLFGDIVAVNGFLLGDGGRFVGEWCWCIVLVFRVGGDNTIVVNV